MDVPIDYADYAATTTHYLHEPDPLVLELDASSGPLAWVDPMLEEFASSLVVSRPAEHRCLGARPPWRLPLRVWKHRWWTPVLRRRLLSGR